MTLQHHRFIVAQQLSFHSMMNRSMMISMMGSIAFYQMTIIIHLSAFTDPNHVSYNLAYSGEQKSGHIMIFRNFSYL